eukprot:1170316-Rhodomonas_salina.3
MTLRKALVSRSADGRGACVQVMDREPKDEGDLRVLQLTPSFTASRGGGKVCVPRAGVERC